MTARCIPDEPRFDRDHGAEEVVWRALREQLPDEAVLFHSIGLLDGAEQREVDLLVGWPGHGMAVIEVKGGRVQCLDGQWLQSGKPMGRSPVEQVNAERHPLHSYLRKRGCSAAGSRLAHLVAFPQTHVPDDWSAPDCPRATVIGHGDVAADAVRTALERHGKHAAGSAAIRAGGEPAQHQADRADLRVADVLWPLEGSRSGRTAGCLSAVRGVRGARRRGQCRRAARRR